MTMFRRTFISGLAALGLAPALEAQASDFPAKPLKVIYTYSPGGTGDSMTRVLAESMGQVLGQPVVVENKTGANGTIGIMAAARSPADGYTLVLTTITTTVAAPLVTDDPSQASEKILAPIAGVSVTPLVLLAHPSVPADDFPSFVKWARSQSSGVDFATAGPTLEVSNALLAREGKFKIVNVNYRGSAQALQALMAGDVKIFFNPPSAAMMEFIKQGRVKVLGVTTAEPSPLIEGGVPIQKYLAGYVQDINFAVWAPKDTPADVKRKLEDAIRKSLAKPGMAKRFHDMGTTARFIGPEEVTRITRRETKNFDTAIKEANVKFR